MQAIFKAWNWYFLYHRVFFIETVFTAHSTTSLYSCAAHYNTVWCCTVTVCIHSTFYNLTVQLSYSLLHCLMLYCDSLYSQHILQPYCTAVLLTTTLSDAVQWQFVFTAHSTTLLCSCPAPYVTAWCSSVTVAKTSVKRHIWTRVIVWEVYIQYHAAFLKIAL